MRFIYGRQDMRDLRRAQENCFLMTNGLGGYTSLSAAYGVTRGDQGLLVSAKIAPVSRYTLVQRIREYALSDHEKIFFSTKEALEEKDLEDGYRHISSFSYEDDPKWIYETGGITVERRMAMLPYGNVTAILYQVRNQSHEDITYVAEPSFLCDVKGSVRNKPCNFIWDGEKLNCEDCQVYLAGDMKLLRKEVEWESLCFFDDEKDGRVSSGLNFMPLRLETKVKAGESASFSLVFSDSPVLLGAKEIFARRRMYEEKLMKRVYFRDPMARQLVKSADAYVTFKESKGGKTIVAPQGAEIYTNREEDYPYKITKEDLAYQLFTEKGFIWGGSWSNTKDYQHFEIDTATCKKLYPACGIK